jgi:hypothetical protein
MSLQEMNNGSDTYTKEVKYKDVTIFVEKEIPDEDNNMFSAIIYCNQGEWHEFEGSGLFFEEADAIEYCKNVIDRDNVKPMV